MCCLHWGLYFQIQLLQFFLSSLICWASHLCGSSPDLQPWPFSSCPALPSSPRRSRKWLPALPYAQSFCKDDSERDLSLFLKPQDAVGLFGLATHNSPHHPVPPCPLHSVIQLLLPQSHLHTLLFPIPHQAGALLVLLFTKMIQILLLSLSHVSSPSHTLKSYPITQRGWTDLPVCF